MNYTNFENLSLLKNVVNDFNFTQTESIIADKEYIQLTQIEYKYYAALSTIKNMNDYNKIKNEILHDFGEHKVLLTYLNLVFKERYLIKLLTKLKRDVFLRTVKVQIIVHMFIMTIKYGDGILARPTSVKLEKDAIISNFHLYLLMINQVFLYNPLGVIDFAQAQMLRRILKVELEWDIDKTFDLWYIKNHNLFALKVFNFEKEIIKTNYEGDERTREFGFLVYHTYMKVLVHFISANIIKSLHGKM